MRRPANRADRLQPGAVSQSWRREPPSRPQPEPCIKRVPAAFSRAFRRHALGVVAASLILAACGAEPPPRIRIGSQMPEFSLPSLAGQRIDSDSLSGKAMVLNFWATWCQPCLKEIPELVELAADDRLAVVGIALDQEGEAAVRPFVEKHGMDYTILLGDQDIFSRMGGLSIPYTLVLDASQQVVNIYRGPATRDDIERDLARIEPAA